MGNAPASNYDLESTITERDDEEPPAVLRPSKCAAALASFEDACCCLDSTEIRRRRFDATALPMISEGDVFILRGWRNTREKTQSLFTRFFTGVGGADDASADGDADEQNVQKVLGSSCIVTANRDFYLRWKSLELENNKKSKYRGVLALSEVHHVRSVREAPSQTTFELVNAQGTALLALEAHNKLLRDNWVKALSEFLLIYASKIESLSELHRSKIDKQARLKNRRDAIQQRRMAAKAKISKLGLTGMRHSAKARMEAVV